MTIIIKSPSSYIQGAEELSNLGKYIKKLGPLFFVLGSSNSKKRFADRLGHCLADAGKDQQWHIFSGECSQEEIDKAVAACTASSCDAVIGIGGGKSIDTAKVVADILSLPIIVIPTVASNDAPCSGLAVIYNTAGVVVKVHFTKRNPDMVLVDTSLIANAPPRLFTAGMGDALATWFEARATHASQARTVARGRCSATALAMARLCFDILLQDGRAALMDVAQSIASPAVERVVEASIYLSGIGFESGGLAAAHAVNDGLALIPDTHGMYHGEKVAFGVLVQLILEKAPASEYETVIRFMKDVGLPITLEQLGVATLNEADLRQVAEAACAPAQSTKNMSVPVTVEDMFQAILEADRRGRFL